MRLHGCVIAMASLGAKDDFKVLIIGGSIAGLTLAHCLEKLNVSYEILEQGHDISPQVGASVGILPNGAQVLDQLGIFDEVEKAIEPLTFARIRYPDGFFFHSQYPSVLRSRFGYPVAFLERQRLLEILYGKLEGKSHVHTGQRVVKVDDEGHRAVVRTADGKEYTGDLVVGADGVHSIVRSEIWRHDAEAGTGLVTTKEKENLKIDFACIFGISSGVKGVPAGLQLSLLDHGLTIHVFNGKDTKAYWFVIIKIDRRYRYGQGLKYTSDDARKTCAAITSKVIDEGLTFGHLWDRCQVFTMTPLEEGNFSTWHRGRLVCVGDAVRKVTPNIGQGANMAIEDIAALANAIWRYRRNPTSITAAVSSIRLARTRSVCRQSEMMTRMQAHEGLLRRVLVRLILPALHDIPAASSAVVLGGSQRLAFAPMPGRAGQKGSSWTFVWTYSKSAFQIPTMTRMDVFLCDRTMTREYYSLDEEHMSFQAAMSEEFQFKYSLPGQQHDIRKIPNSVIGKALSWQRNRSNNVEDPFFADFSKEFLHGFQHEMEAFRQKQPSSSLAFFSHAAEPKAGWMAVPCFPLALKIVARLTTKSLFGEPLCRDDYFLDLCCQFADAVPRVAMVLRCFPSFVRPFVAKYLPGTRLVQKLRVFVLDEVTSRRKSRAENPMKDLLDFVMNWADEQQEDWSDLEVSDMIINVVFAALHTSSQAIADCITQLVTHTIFELATRPEYVPELREEIQKCFQVHGQGTKAAVDAMHKVDSFIKETQRCNVLDAAALARLVLKPYTFSNGLHIPQGTYIFTPNSPLLEDERFYADPSRFDGLRFARMRNDVKLRASCPLTATNEHSMHFGIGRNACPGRFMVSDEVKLVMIHLLLNMELAMEGFGPRPRNVAFDSVLVVAAVGVWSKLRSGFGLVEVPSPARLLEPGSWLEDLGGVSVALLWEEWPWFSLHLFLYLGQLIPFAIMLEMTSPLRKLRAVSLLSLLSAIFGFAAAMPALSLWILQVAEHKGLSRRQRSVLGTLAFPSTVTHIGAFVVALSTAYLGLDSSPWHVMNSLLSVPDYPGRLPEKAVREARLRQINEMTGTSSGFFMSAGLLLLRLESCGQEVSVGLVAWMFLVSLVAGPAAGSAVVMLLADEVAAADETRKMKGG
ncbi:hypothetical protein CDD80_6197 [Ophiocordyceps camponoti-rufipedis]|uniref:FAD-binding domain-containing protein n=1 Tax=Ophiocordyceps camponoti-rufipedis TaxID=2004952 RepID=A0A2C5ZFP0_9HYPO|nr:hypothetical protein CDD80_6197 [Ophiocordyceps camponoti-rufipedis]